MGKLDPNEAPDGYVAMEDDASNACDFCDIKYGSSLCMDQRCAYDEREDGCNVRYRLNPPAIWPYDSEGTPVEVEA